MVFRGNGSGKPGPGPGPLGGSSWCFNMGYSAKSLTLCVFIVVKISFTYVCAWSLLMYRGYAKAWASWSMASVVVGAWAAVSDSLTNVPTGKLLAVVYMFKTPLK